MVLVIQTHSFLKKIRILSIEKFQERRDLLPGERRARSPISKAARVGDQRALGRDSSGKKTIWISYNPITKPCFANPGKHTSGSTTTCIFSILPSDWMQMQQVPVSVPPVQTHAVKLLWAIHFYFLTP